MRFKRVLKKATKDGYFIHNPSEELPAKVGGNKKLKEILTAEILFEVNEHAMSEP